ncbi:hypothetical protein [Humisphaera borealis]|uniref:DoxX protein n=1 Tax=Humisphaera borealis TaxID=2807512 RepID=A0A7M2WRD4_9BACT|nr:hypothetical protein [Humisphaera borealis]QOV88036.1 DoxX protein [Humisphaera borealis]
MHSITLPIAHEKWFYDATTLPASGHHLVETGVIVAIGVAVAVTVVAGLLWRRRGKRDLIPGPAYFGATPAGRARFYALAPLILAVHLCVPMFKNGIDGRLLAPNNVLFAPWTFVIGLSQMLVAIAFVYGAFTRLAAGLLVAIWVLGLGLCGPESMADNVVFIGIAAFFWAAGRGPWSADAMLLPNLAPSGRHARFAMPALRIGLALSLITLAFTEKLANLALADAFLQRNAVNFTGFLHIPMSNHDFAICAGGVELTVGLLLLFGYFPRVVILLAWLPFNASLLVFRGEELIGHLPLYAALGLLLVWTPADEDQTLFRNAVSPATRAGATFGP